MFWINQDCSSQCHPTPWAGLASLITRGLDAVTPPQAADRRFVALGGFFVAAFVLAGMLRTAPSMAIAWDEAYTLNRLARVRLWFEALADPPKFAAKWPNLAIRRTRESVRLPGSDELDTRSELFSHDVLAWFWPFARDEPHGHPPFYAIAAVLGDVLAPAWDELPRARVGTMIAFSLAAGAIFSALYRRRGVVAGLAGASAWALHPHLFGLGHYATYDALLSSLWVGAVLAFAAAVGRGDEERRRPHLGWAMATGVLLGWAAGTKLTGWLLPIPLLACAAIWRDPRAWRACLVTGAVAVLTIYVFTPPFWARPFSGVVEFFRSNLGRQETIPIRVMFLGHDYETPRESLPPWNTLAWTAFVTPVGFLGLAIWGAIASAKNFRADRLGASALASWAFLLVLRALPGAPGHDGVRQFLPAFGMLAILAGLGAAETVAKLGKWGKALVAAAIMEGAVSVALLMPTPLSYFSPLIWGTPGAARIGLEPTYYWDSLTDDALAKVDEIAGPDGRVAFIANPIAFYYEQTGKLKSDLYMGEGPPPTVYVVQNRPGNLDPKVLRVVRRYGADPRYIVASKFGVPLAWAFPASTFRDVGIR